MKSIFAVLIQSIEKRYLTKIETYEWSLKRKPVEGHFSEQPLVQFD